MKTLGELAQIIKAELVGDPEASVQRARSFELAGEGDVTLAADAAYRARIGESRATAIIVASAIDHLKRNLLIAANPKLAFARAIQALHRVEYLAMGLSGDLILGAGSALGKDLSIHPRVTIGRDSIVGDRVTPPGRCNRQQLPHRRRHGNPSERFGLPGQRDRKTSNHSLRNGDWRRRLQFRA